MGNIGKEKKLKTIISSEKLMKTCFWFLCEENSYLKKLVFL